MAHKHPSLRALQRQVSWGEMLDLTVNRTGPGLKPLVEFIGTATGGWLGSRNQTLNRRGLPRMVRASVWRTSWLP